MFKIRCTYCNNNLDGDKDLIIYRNQDGDDEYLCPHCNNNTFVTGWIFKQDVSNQVNNGNYNNGDYDNDD